MHLGENKFDDPDLGDNACHPEPFASLKGKLREGSGSTNGEILRCAQDDSSAESALRGVYP